MKLSLIGYRATGKTTLARLLAARVGCAWHDTDDLIVERAGKSIRQIFQAEGEAGFRDLEALVIRDVTRSDHGVLALGGGAVLRDENREAIRAYGPAIWLQADAASIFRRMQTDAATTDQRPDLTSLGGLAEVEQLLAARQSAYESCASHVIDVTQAAPEALAEEVLRLLATTNSD